MLDTRGRRAPGSTRLPRRVLRATGRAHQGALSPACRPPGRSRLHSARSLPRTRSVMPSESRCPTPPSPAVLRLGRHAMSGRAGRSGDLPGAGPGLQLCLPVGESPEAATGGHSWSLWFGRLGHRERRKWQFHQKAPGPGASARASIPHAGTGMGRSPARGGDRVGTRLWPRCSCRSWGGSCPQGTPTTLCPPPTQVAQALSWGHSWAGGCRGC